MTNKIVYVVTGMDRSYEGLYSTIEEANTKIIELIGEGMDEYLEELIDEGITLESHLVDKSIEYMKDAMSYSTIVPIFVDVTKPIYVMYNGNNIYSGATNNFEEFKRYAKGYFNKLDDNMFEWSKKDKKWLEEFIVRLYNH
jgi:hypothetical protein